MNNQNGVNITPVTEQDIEDAALLLIMSVNAYVGFEKSALEVAGAAHTVLSVAIQNLNKQHEQTTKISEVESGQRTAIESGQIQGAGPDGRSEEGTERLRSNGTRKAQGSSKKESGNKNLPGANLPQKSS